MSRQVSSLEVSQGGEGGYDDDPLAVPDMTPRGTNENDDGREQSPTASSSSTALAKQYMSLPIIYLVFFVQLFLASVKSVAQNPTAMWNEFWETNRETNELLAELPKEQKGQRRELEHIHEEQIHQSDKLQDLRRRINRLEQRQRERQEAMAKMGDPMPKLEAYVNDKKDK